MSWRKTIKQTHQPAWQTIAGQIGREVPGVSIEVGADSSKMVTLRAGGPVSLLITVCSENDLKQVISWLTEYEINWAVVSGGSNILIREGGFLGALIRLGRNEGSEEGGFTDVRVETLERVDEVYAGSAVPTAKLIKLARQNGWSDVAPLAGIPGLLGGAVCMNAGSRTVWLSRFVENVRVMDHKGTIRVQDPEKLKMQYRSSGIGRHDIVMDMKLKFERDDCETTEKLINEQLQYRANSQPVASLNCGSVFVNPDGESAGRLIDAAGLKGLRIHGASVSMVHANFIENNGEATATDIEALIWLVHRRVLEETGIDLNRELRIIGKEL